MRFAKLHGLGNDFILLDMRGLPGAPPSPQRATELCDRHRGIGADGVLTLLDGDRFVDGRRRAAPPLTAGCDRGHTPPLPPGAHFPPLVYFAASNRGDTKPRRSTVIKAIMST